MIVERILQLRVKIAPKSLIFGARDFCGVVFARPVPASERGRPRSENGRFLVPLVKFAYRGRQLIPPTRYCHETISSRLTRPPIFDGWMFR